MAHHWSLGPFAFIAIVTVGREKEYLFSARLFFLRTGMDLLSLCGEWFRVLCVRVSLQRRAGLPMQLLPFH